jgi:hypothetical protein
MDRHMDRHMDAHRPTPIRPGAEPCTDHIERAGLPWGPARPREDGVGAMPKAVARAIEDLQRSGYRPLHARLAAPGASSILRAGAAPGHNV